MPVTFAPRTLVVIAFCLTQTSTTNGFAVTSSSPSLPLISSALQATSDESSSICTSRREALMKGIGGAFGMASIALGSMPQEASASYSAYAAREKDWQTRGEAGEIKISTARDLKAQLREIAPMNGERTAIFCPNGPSAAVSPLMENKCGDRLAAPSVYGRTTDVVGNSIPGFAGGKYPSSTPGDSSSLNANPLVGGFPEYRAKVGK
eukprot:CAMPEP_0172480794 /NCGR_PEP_ID=MMETSP1066-20121228/6238_1 /TAXON_ID=671091 /ORGANISM="Coscinodiscus wailesii, Strain CCMP2513" /LENGTH=206 /DNA_ID=CAMNT_0013242477 /DNA_START=120 /DNA_END=740 /DNA_ORIENTATION=+